MCWCVALSVSFLVGNGRFQAARGESGSGPKVWLLEFDKRFEVFEEFVFYDFNNPLKLPRECYARDRGRE
jgi:hypothetical protein